MYVYVLFLIVSTSMFVSLVFMCLCVPTQVQLPIEIVSAAPKPLPEQLSSLGAFLVSTASSRCKISKISVRITEAEAKGLRAQHSKKGQ
jgi:hypothetical protein